MIHVRFSRALCGLALLSPVFLQAQTPQLTASPAAIGFSAFGGIVNEAPQRFTVSSGCVSAPITVVPSDAWIDVTQFNGGGGGAATPSTWLVKVDPSGMPDGFYQGQITISTPGFSPAVVTVTLDTMMSGGFVLSPPGSVRATPKEIRVTYVQGLPSVPPIPILVEATFPPPEVFFEIWPGEFGWITSDITSGATTPATANILIDPSSEGPGFYFTELSLFVSPDAIPLPVLVSVSPPLAVDNPSLFFAATVGSSPPPKSVSVTSGGMPAVFVPAVSTGSGGNWLSVAGNCDTPGSMSASVNTTGVPPGTHNGTITFLSPDSGIVQVAVTLDLAGPPVPLTAAPQTLSFPFVIGAAAPSPRPIDLSGGGPNTAYIAGVSTSSGGGWLSVAPASGSSPATLQVTANPTGLPPGIYNGQVLIDPIPATGSQIVVPVTLSVTTPLVVGTTPLTFNYVLGSGVHPPQTISVTSPTAPLVFTAAAATGSGGNWLFATPANGTTPASVSVSVIPAGLQPGSYSGGVTIDSPAASNGPTTVPVTLNVRAPLTLSENTVGFSFNSGDASPASKTVTLSGSAMPFTTGTPSAAWLSVSASGTTSPATLTISANPAGLGPGTHNAHFVITAPNASNSPLTISVSATVNTSLSASPSSLSFSFTTGDALPASQTIAVGGGETLEFSASASTTSGNWLSVSGGGLTPDSLSVSVNPAGLAVGLYNGTVTITSGSATNSPLTVPVTLTVVAALSAEPASLSFTAVVGGDNPPPQTFSVSAGAGLAFTTVVSTGMGGPWLSVKANGASTPSTVSVSVNAVGLTAGTYFGSVTLNAPNSTGPKIVGVLLSVVPPGDLVLSPPSLAFSGVASVAGPLTQSITVTSTNSIPLPFRVAAEMTGAAAGRISVSPASGFTPAQVTVTVDPGGLPAGEYPAAIRFTVLQKVQTVEALLTIRDAPPSLSVTPEFVDLKTTAGGAFKRTLFIQNRGGGAPQTFAVSVTQGAWLSVLPSSGVLTGSAAVPVELTVNPAELSSGPYRGSVRIEMGSLRQDVPVEMFVSGGEPLIGLEFSGIAFEARAGEGLSLAREIGVRNWGSGRLSWSTSVSSGGDWLSITELKPDRLRLSTNAEGREPGTYYATVEVSDTGADNSPQTITVVLRVLPATAQPVPEPSPGGLLFVTAEAANPAPQTVQVFTSSKTPTPVRASAQTNDGANWLAVDPQSRVVSTARTGSVNVSVNSTGLKPGVYRGGIAFSMSAGVVRMVNVTLIVTAGASSAKASGPRGAEGCAPTQLVPVYTGLLNSFSAPAGWPMPVTLRLVDDCGSSILNGNVVARFSQGEPRFLTLSQIDDTKAVYSATWVPSAPASQMTVAANATSGSLSGQAEVTGIVADNLAPVLKTKATLSTLNPQVGGALTPGGVVQIYGENLAPAEEWPSAIPLPTEMSGTRVIIGGLSAPLFYVSRTHINAQIPVELEPRPGYPVLVSANGALTVPDTINLVPADPAVAAYAEGGVIAQHLDYGLVTPDKPAAPGEIVTVYLVGMGATDVPVASGMPGPSEEPLARVRLAPSVELDGKPAETLFAGLAPGSVGLYAIIFKVPDDATTGDLTLIIKQQDKQSNSSTLPVRGQ